MAARAADRTIPVMLMGGMGSFQWGIVGGRPLTARRGERIHIVMQNHSMMAHPVHLHGHHFQVVGINGRPVSGAVGDTVHAPPLSPPLPHGSGNDGDAHLRQNRVTSVGSMNQPRDWKRSIDHETDEPGDDRTGSGWLLALGAPLRAQQSGMGMRDMPMGPGTMMGPGIMGMMRMMGDCPMMGMMMGADTSTFAEGRIAFLKAELAITDAQKAAWETYAAALKKNLQAMQAMRESMTKLMEARTPVERLDAHIAGMDGRLASLKEVKPALVALYGALSDDQKKKADQILTGMGCMM